MQIVNVTHPYQHIALIYIELNIIQNVKSIIDTLKVSAIKDVIDNLSSI